MLVKRFAIGALSALTLISLSTTVWSQQAPARAGAAGAQQAPGGRGGAGAQAPGRGGAAAAGRGGAGRGAQDPAAAAAARAAEDARLAALPKKNITLAQGRLAGFIENGVVRFNGIPYAAPPVGELRWKAPAAAARWQGVRDATRPGNGCANNEDCLFLNISTPEGAKPGDRMPVMVWIHGGSYTSGQGSSYDGINFNRQGIVVVTINYRLGRAGFFAHPALTREGQAANFGILDQAASLKWIKDNISAFGGNPGNVTIFGESAGAGSILYLTLAPQARGLFHKVIAESGFPRNNPGRLQDLEAYSVRAAEAAGVRGNDAAAAAALRRLPLSAFPAGNGYFDNTRAFPILDNKVISSSIIDGYIAGRQAKVPFMIGGMSNDASLYNRTPEMLNEVPNRPAMTRAFNPNSSKSDRQLINDYWTVMRMTEPNRAMGRIMAATGQPTFLFYFSYVRPAQRATSMGAAHASEIPYVFNTVTNAGGEDLSTAQSMNAYWASFAKYANPGAAGGPNWPKYEAASDTWMEFGNDGVHATPRLLRAQLDYMENAPGRIF